MVSRGCSLRSQRRASEKTKHHKGNHGPGNIRRDRDREKRADGKVNEAAIVFARATSLYRLGQLERAIELFNEVIAVSSDEDPQQDVACVAAHISLYKIHRSLGHEREASEHFNKAVSLGANAKRLQES